MSYVEIRVEDAYTPDLEKNLDPIEVYDKNEELYFRPYEKEMRYNTDRWIFILKNVLGIRENMVDFFATSSFYYILTLNFIYRIDYELNVSLVIDRNERNLIGIQNSGEFFLSEGDYWRLHNDWGEPTLLLADLKDNIFIYRNSRGDFITCDGIGKQVSILDANFNLQFLIKSENRLLAAGIFPGDNLLLYEERVDNLVFYILYPDFSQKDSFTVSGDFTQFSIFAYLEDSESLSNFNDGKRLVVMNPKVKAVYDLEEFYYN